MEEARDEWLTLSETARLLGVHPSTLRAWCDRGLLPVYRTQGGHRRFRRSEIELWAQARRQGEEMALADLMRKVIGQVRPQLSEGRLLQRPWFKKLSPEARQYYRQSAHLLLQQLAAYLASDDEQNLRRAEALGYDYAIHGRRFGLTLVEAADAFLFFRTRVLEAFIQLYARAHVLSDRAWSQLITRFHEFTDRLLLHLITTYQQLDQRAASRRDG